MLDRIALITRNVGKAAEYGAMLGIEVTPARAELTEAQSLDSPPSRPAMPPTLSRCFASQSSSRIRA